MLNLQMKPNWQALLGLEKGILRCCNWCFGCLYAVPVFVGKPLCWLIYSFQCKHAKLATTRNLLLCAVRMANVSDISVRHVF